MKIIIEKQVIDGENTKWEKTAEVEDEKTALDNRKEGERIHICYHDEKPVKSCVVK